MRPHFFALAIAFAAALPARGDSLGNEFATNGGTFYVPGHITTVEPINSTYVPGVGIDNVFFSYGATSNTFFFSADTTLLFDPNGQPASIGPITFVDQRKLDDVTGFTLDPSSTLLGIVPTIGVFFDGPMYGYESTFTFDFSKVTLQPGQQATFDAVFASSQTPEPSSLLLLATGLLGIAAGVKYRSA